MRTMTKRVFVAAIAMTAFAARTGPDRTALASVEKMIDRRIETLFDDPFLLLGMTRGVYVEGVGAIYSAEVGLAVASGNPMARPTPQEMDRLRRKRLERLPALRAAMQDILGQAAARLTSLPPTERVVLGVTLFRRADEDSSGIPAQIVMQATRKSLMDREPNAIRVDEF